MKFSRKTLRISAREDPAKASPVTALKHESLPALAKHERSTAKVHNLKTAEEGYMDTTLASKSTGQEGGQSNGAQRKLVPAQAKHAPPRRPLEAFWFEEERERRKYRYGLLVLEVIMAAAHMARFLFILMYNNRQMNRFYGHKGPFYDYGFTVPAGQASSPGIHQADATFEFFASFYICFIVAGIFMHRPWLVMTAVVTMDSTIFLLILIHLMKLLIIHQKFDDLRARAVRDGRLNDRANPYPHVVTVWYYLLIGWLLFDVTSCIAATFVGHKYREKESSSTITYKRKISGARTSFVDPENEGL